MATGGKCAAASAAGNCRAPLGLTLLQPRLQQRRAELLCRSWLAPLGLGPLRLSPLGRGPLRLAPLGLAPLGLAPLGLAPLGLAPLGLAPLGLVPSPEML